MQVHASKILGESFAEAQSIVSTVQDVASDHGDENVVVIVDQK